MAKKKPEKKQPKEKAKKQQPAKPAKDELTDDQLDKVAGGIEVQDYGFDVNMPVTVSREKK
jgi:hypothetical protein